MNNIASIELRKDGDDVYIDYIEIRGRHLLKGDYGYWNRVHLNDDDLNMFYDCLNKIIESK